jgi:transcriptional/translational regulatory protein YebC/TACO1
VVTGEETHIVYTAREALSAVESKLSEAGYKITDSGLSWLAKNEIELGVEESMQVTSLLEKLEELDDVQNVASNLNISDEVAAAMA